MVCALFSFLTFRNPQPLTLHPKNLKKYEKIGYSGVGWGLKSVNYSDNRGGKCGPIHYGDVFDGKCNPIGILWKGFAVQLVPVKLGVGTAV